MRSWSQLIKINDPKQQKQTPGQSVNKEFERDCLSAVTSPSKQDKIDRNQRQFPEYVKKKSILCHENSQ